MCTTLVIYFSASVVASSSCSLLCCPPSLPLYFWHLPVLTPGLLDLNSWSSFFCSTVSSWYSTVVWYHKWTPVLPILSLIVVLAKTSTSSAVAAKICAAGCFPVVAHFLETGSYGKIWAVMVSKLFLIPSGPLSVLTLAIAACRPGSGH